MPTFKDMVENQAGLGTYGYTGQRIDPNEFGTNEMTLFTLVVDRSGSMSDFQDHLVECVKIAIRGCKKGPRPENIMVRVVDFGSNLHEIHGFRLLTEVKESDYDHVIRIHGNTALCDAFENAISGTLDYGQQMSGKDFDVNGIIAVATDGFENDSDLKMHHVKEMLGKALKGEYLESLVTILIGFGMTDNPDDEGNKQLELFKKETGIMQYEKVKDMTDESFAKVGRFISRSVSSQSVALNTGKPSEPLKI